MKKKHKIILIISAVVVLALIIVFAWNKLSGPEKPTTPQEGEGELPKEAGEGGKKQEGPGFSLTRLSDEGVEVFDFWEDSGSGQVYYVTTKGVVRSAKQGPDPEISTRQFSAINKVRPDEDGERVLVSFGDPASPSWGMFDSSDGVWRPLPSYIKDMVWGKEEDKVIAVAVTEGGKSLVSLDIEKLKNGENETSDILVRNFSLKDVELSFSEPNSLVIMEKPASFYGSRVWKFDIKEKKLTKIMAAKKGLMMNWDESGLVFEYEGEGNRFSILDKELNGAIPVIFTTFPSKCDATPEKVYCFVPYNSLSDLDNLQLPEAYFKNKFYTSDSLYEVDIESGKSEKKISMLDFDINLDAYLPEEIGEDIYFVNKYNRGLYQLKLTN
ncbi:hypothetical protein AKJ56_00725 [candidate division MSBL1 archaeon SCGC-AAA382N08]|uniref:DUF5050 domain-containing protein n=1 Tax=candidate division MSBL1 archaeon SCGC-AAA382N08 TaxID=1698285 RepID=A0A133VQC8_9EURY|nr:hypothetical protein AKJ56_00725 [candidate division MSBL1 archaeon SCGC-AAA382N08]